MDKYSLAGLRSSGSIANKSLPFNLVVICHPNMDILNQLQAWYKSNCNGDWEHSFGVSIDTLDNPGWTVTIDLAETPLCNKDFEAIELNLNSDNDWLFCKVEKEKFVGACGPDKLEQLLTVFLSWARGI